MWKLCLLFRLPLLLPLGSPPALGKILDGVCFSGFPHRSAPREPPSLSYILILYKGRVPGQDPRQNPSFTTLPKSRIPRLGCGSPQDPHWIPTWIPEIREKVTGGEMQLQRDERRFFLVHEAMQHIGDVCRLPSALLLFAASWYSSHPTPMKLVSTSCLGGKSSHVRWHLASTVVELTAIVANVVVPKGVCARVGAKDST